MPAQSKSQQRLFAMVRAYQKGDMPDANAKIKRIAKHISPEDADKYASTKHADIKERSLVLKKVFDDQEYVKETIHDIVETGTPDYVKGQLVDRYTASMLLTVSNRLTEENKQKLFSHSLNEMVAISYKILTY